jgi:hypothetical protein
LVTVPEAALLLPPEPDDALAALPAPVVAAGADDELDELLQAVAATVMPTSSTPAA